MHNMIEGNIQKKEQNSIGVIFIEDFNFHLL